MKKIRNFLAFIIVFGAVTYVVVAFYPYLFSRHIKGKITGVEKIVTPMTLVTVNGQDPSSQMFSYAVGIQDEKTKEILTASTEDRQWAVATVGLCAEAQFFPYPPWNLKKWGTYYNARLTKLHECEPTAAN
jgi:hypothetical protein